MGHKDTDIAAAVRSEKRRNVLPMNLPPIGLSRAEAAAYIGISPTKFDDLVRDGRMPPSKSIDTRRVWDRFALDRAFAELPDGDAAQVDWEAAL